MNLPAVNTVCCFYVKLLTVGADFTPVLMNTNVLVNSDHLTLSRSGRFILFLMENQFYETYTAALARSVLAFLFRREGAAVICFTEVNRGAMNIMKK